MLRNVVFIALALVSLTPWVKAPVALVAGVAFGLLWGTPFTSKLKVAQTALLQASVVGLGAAMNLGRVLRVGAAGFAHTAISIAAVFAVGALLSKLLRTERTTSLLVTVGTAICGGSAIAAVAPAVGANPQQTSVALAVVFLLNALALVLFPAVGHWLSLDPRSFGLWSALAIHDTNSVVGASLQFAPEALSIATTVKLARALWIIPMTLVLSRVWSSNDGASSAPKRPWFIAGFVAMAAVVTWIPALRPAGQWVAAASRQVLVLTLFLIGAGVSREALRTVGAKPIALGALLWIAVATLSLGAIRAGVI